MKEQGRVVFFLIIGKRTWWAFFALTGNLRAENVPFIFLQICIFDASIFNMKPYLLAFGTNEMIIIVIISVVIIRKVAKFLSWWWIWVKGKWIQWRKEQCKKRNRRKRQSMKNSPIINSILPIPPISKRRFFLLYLKNNTMLNLKTELKPVYRRCNIILGSIASAHISMHLLVYTDEAAATGENNDQAIKDSNPTGRLHGVVIAIKDVICYKGHHVTVASAILKNLHPLFCYRQLNGSHEGAIIARLCELWWICNGFFLYRELCLWRSLNTLDESRVPGGSSGGFNSSTGWFVYVVSEATPADR